MKFMKFEGPEKKLEIILFSPQPGLRSNRNGRWRQVVEAAKANIISEISTPKLDAYLLSESSLFVWDNRLLMITCGQTVLIDAIPVILDILDKRNVAFLFYERKNFMYPEEQPSNFEENALELLDFFPGKSYRLGPANHDHIHIFYSSHAVEKPKADATLQILMNDLHPSSMEIFCAATNKSLIQEEMLNKLERLYPEHPDMLIDKFSFEPYGYSLNGIHDENYYTIHVTPQHEGSYASFEANFIETDYSRIIKAVISVFNPEKYSIVLTTSMDEPCLPLHNTVENIDNDYRITEKSYYEFDCGYMVTFLNYLKNNSV